MAILNAAKLDHPILPESEIRALVARHRAGDPDAAQIIISHNERAIFRVVLRYHSTGVCGDVPVEDLMQMGRMGIIRALQDFDLESGNKFLTYAWAWIRMYVSRYGEKEGQQVKLSYRASSQKTMIGIIRADYIQKNHCEPTEQELSELSGINLSQVTRLRVNVRSLDVAFDSKQTTFGETLPSPEGDPSEEIENRLVLEGIQEKMSNLPARWQKILNKYYGLDGKPAQSMAEIARSIGITKERVRQIKNDALCRLREQIQQEDE